MKFNIILCGVFLAVITLVFLNHSSSNKVNSSLDASEKNSESASNIPDCSGESPATKSESFIRRSSSLKPSERISRWEKITNLYTLDNRWGGEENFDLETLEDVALKKLEESLRKPESKRIARILEVPDKLSLREFLFQEYMTYGSYAMVAYAVGFESEKWIFLLGRESSDYNGRPFMWLAVRKHDLATIQWDSQKIHLIE